MQGWADAKPLWVGTDVVGAAPGPWGALGGPGLWGQPAGSALSPSGIPPRFGLCAHMCQGPAWPRVYSSGSLRNQGVDQGSQGCPGEVRFGPD